ncbi:MAG: transglycosylase SLT domain-containing protein [Pseudomonadota bacterium]
MNLRLPPLRWLAVFVGALAVTGAAPTRAAPGDADVREQFRLAYAQAERGLAGSAPDSEVLRGYVLYPDLQAARLLFALDAAADSELDKKVDALLAAYPDLPVARELRRRWLLSLADRGLWSEFLRRYTQADEALVCHYYLARIQTTVSAEERTALAAELADFWRTAPQMPAACLPPFRWLEQQPVFTTALVVQRARNALHAGNLELADWLIRKLPEVDAAPLRRWARLLRDPGAELAAIAANPQLEVEWDALVAGYGTLAVRDPDRALQLLPRLGRERFDARQYAQLQRWTALGLSWDRRPEAIEWFQALPDEVADERVHEWRVRSALWQRRMELASVWLHGLPPRVGEQSGWAYWRARSLQAVGREQQAIQLFRTLAQENGYYSLLSAWRLGEPYRPRARAFPDDPAAQRELGERLPIVRARELYFVGRDHWANIEWIRATRDLDAAMRLQAARLASRWGWHLQAVTILAELDALDILEVSYPEAFDDYIRRSARDVGLPPEWIYGLMRQESLFHPRAVSPSNAYGLLQLLLPTAREVARRRGEPAPSPEDLFEPEVNIPLGATYLSEMRSRFGGQFVPAVAAYNAGPNAVKRWLPQTPLDADIWIENVPYTQTRGYVQKVLWHIAARGWRKQGEPQDLSPLLRPVQAQ